MCCIVVSSTPFIRAMAIHSTVYKDRAAISVRQFRLEINEKEKNWIVFISYTKLNNGFEFICTIHMALLVSCCRCHSSTSLFAFYQFIFYAVCVVLFCLWFLTREKNWRKCFKPFDSIPRNSNVNKAKKWRKCNSIVWISISVHFFECDRENNIISCLWFQISVFMRIYLFYFFGK